ncbi:E3 Ubiquitin-Protein Ligase Nedd4-Like [Manis pentadactyla]|nr:E3 Ubiquitin-Protein Ligase Nedd4-Like [Manis pentadactyla]
MPSDFLRSTSYYTVMTEFLVMSPQVQPDAHRERIHVQGRAFDAPRPAPAPASSGPFSHHCDEFKQYIKRKKKTPCIPIPLSYSRSTCDPLPEPDRWDLNLDAALTYGSYYA